MATSKERIWNRSFVLVILVNGMTGIASQMVIPLVSKYAVSIGAPLTLAATIASIMSLAALACRPVSGAVTDIINRKHLMIVSSLLISASVLGYIFAVNIPLLIAMRIVHGVAFSFMTVASMAFAVSFLPESRIGEGLGYLALGNILVQAVGPAFGLWLVENISYTACFAVSAAFSLLAVAVLAFVPYTHTVGPRTKITPGRLFAKELILFTVLIALFSCGNGLISTYLALLGADRGIANVALFFTAYSIVLIAVRPLSGRLLDKKGIKVILYPAYVIFAIGLVLLGAAINLWMIVVAGVLKAVGQGAGTPSIQAYCVKALGKERAGVASSTCLIGQDLGNAIAPIAGGAIAVGYGYGTMFYVFAAIIAVVGCLVFMIQLRREKAQNVRINGGII